MLYQMKYAKRIGTRIRLDSRGVCELFRGLLPGLTLICIAVLSATNSAYAQQSMVAEPVKASISMLDSTREQDGLLGPVRRVHTEMSRLSVNAGTVVEEPRMLLEVTTYDPQGKRIWNVYYPVNTGSFKGNQEFTYDEKGHVKEMALRDDAGRVLSREAYTYEYDSIGNWTTMTSSLVILESGKLVYEPFERTNRLISYYFNDSVAALVKTPSSSRDTAMTASAVNVKDNQKTTEGGASSDVAKESVQPTDTSVTTPGNPLPDKFVLPAVVGMGTEQSEEKRGKSDVDVTASAGVQAYQMPDLPKTTAASTTPNVTGGVISGKILSLPKAVYPQIALSRGIFGKVVVEVKIDEEGRVVDVRALSGNQLLKQSAISAARQARFEPTLLSGQPVKSTRLIKFDFNAR